MSDEIPLAPLPGKSTGRPAAAAGNGPGNAVSEPPRRGFFYKAVAALVGLFVGVVPVAAGVLVFLDPVRRSRGRDSNALWVRVTSLDSLPADGTPMRFPVIADRQDAWTRFTNEPIGAVYLRRVGEGASEVQCFNVTCPHAGCAVTFNADAQQYICPCHTSAFAIDGAAESHVPPRGLDSLETEIRGDEGRREVWVGYQDFYTGLVQKKAKA